MFNNNFFLYCCISDIFSSVFRENDLPVGLDDDVMKKPKLTPIEEKENTLILQLFKNVAGRDQEVDWKELKEILDYYTRKEDTAVAMNMDRVEAAPAAPPPSSNSNNLLTALLALICGALCKKTALADVVPSPVQDLVLNSVNSETKNRGFSKDVCRSMIAMLDTDRTGKLNFEEFKRLWSSIRLWKSIFLQHDKSGTGTLTGFELRDALSSAGYTLNNHILNILMHRYGNKSGEIEFDDFIMCAVKLKMMIELFRQVANSKNTATFSLDDWIENTLYA